MLLQSSYNKYLVWFDLKQPTHDILVQTFTKQKEIEKPQQKTQIQSNMGPLRKKK